MARFDDGLHCILGRKALIKNNRVEYFIMNGVKVIPEIKMYLTDGYEYWLPQNKVHVNSLYRYNQYDRVLIHIDEYNKYMGAY